jgi:proteic killer suppression protein
MDYSGLDDRVVRRPGDGGPLPREAVSPCVALSSGCAEAAVLKLDSLNAALDLQDLRTPPGNRLKALRGDMRGLHSLRVNDQWRLVFRWRGGDAYDVRLTDYH